MPLLMGLGHAALGFFNIVLVIYLLTQCQFFTAEIPMSQPGHQNPTQPEMTMKVY